MKPREFWVSEHGGGASIDWDGPPNYTEDYYLAGNKVWHVVEYEAFQILIDALKEECVCANYRLVVCHPCQALGRVGVENG